MQEGRDFFKSLHENKTRLMEFHAATPCFSATVGPSDALFMPAGWIFMETIGPEDYAGVRLPVVSVRDIDQLEALNRFVCQTKANPFLQRVLDLLSNL